MTPSPQNTPDTNDYDIVLSALMARLQTQDEGALGEIYDCTVAKVYSVVARIANIAADAEEITCDVYRQVWQNAQRYEPERGSVLAWILVIARSRALDHLRRLRARGSDQLHPAGPEVTYTESEDQPLDEFTSALQEKSLIRQALQQLPAIQRRLIGLAFLEDASHQEIAQRTDMPLGTVKSHIRRGLIALKQQLQNVGLEHD
jgi:RNA polymerase sigma-70 factor (ECF subfamily)